MLEEVGGCDGVVALDCERFSLNTRAAWVGFCGLLQSSTLSLLPTFLFSA